MKTLILFLNCFLENKSSYTVLKVIEKDKIYTILVIKGIEFKQYSTDMIVTPEQLNLK